MYYLDTSVLLAYTLTRQLEPARHAATAQLFTLVNTGQIRAVTSFYFARVAGDRHQQHGPRLGSGQ